MDETPGLHAPAPNTVIDEPNRKWWVSAGGALAITAYTRAWAHTDARIGKVVTELC